jgi:DNA recombination-dependent growth factor C
LSGVLDAKGVIGKLKLLGLEDAADDVVEEPLARFDAELALLGGTLRQLIAGLRQALDG